MIPQHIRSDIQHRLREAEEEHQVKVVLAVESGSRAWGFASPNSDYDARFIYVNRPDWYLSVALEEQRDVIEYPIVDEIDINGWDLRKALRLFWKSNPAFVEWIQSPILYRQSGLFAQAAKALLPQVYSCERGIHHYRSMAKTNYRGYLKAELVPLKKYFYVLRPLLAVRWLERYGTAAPIEFSTLLEGIAGEPALLKAIDALLELKRNSPELGLSPQIPEIHAFVERELERLESVVPARADRMEVVPQLSDLFRQVLCEAWPNAGPDQSSSDEAF
ncbi:MAG: nucleotidyltransferase domain-containing protein [Rhodoferax sp.]|nr:nucleotidyltransferase domain-containing protein [Rhodoferax sp.]MDP3654429.1 nucleotidyltransferase domain-containing protein [Rhodoferax sp.]